MAVKNLACNAAAGGSVHHGALVGSTFAAAVRTALYLYHQSLDVGEARRIECGTMSDEAPVCEIHNDGENIFVLIDGVKIAERGLPGTPHAHTWIMLEPGWMVRDVKGGTAIEVRYEPARMH